MCPPRNASASPSNIAGTFAGAETKSPRNNQSFIFLFDHFLRRWAVGCFFLNLLSNLLLPAMLNQTSGCFVSHASIIVAGSVYLNRGAFAVKGKRTHHVMGAGQFDAFCIFRGAALSQAKGTHQFFEPIRKTRCKLEFQNDLVAEGADGMDHCCGDQKSVV